ncbi:MAG: polysaccharide biosynthesis tyrosine autokinase [Dysgonomonas sp.]|nr:polysaccharide biosynthesis tyrosine autokinase [Dysgonomonas sp.]
MEINNNKQNNNIDKDPYFEEVKSKTTFSFDFVLWFYRILKYWYLFIISVALFMAYAYIKNKSWVPYYPIQSIVILESRGTSGIGGVGHGSLQNTENQQFVLQSFGLTERTVKRPDIPARMFIDYFITTRFKTISLYADSPVEVETIELKPEAYYYTYDLTYIDQNQCELSYKEHAEDKTKISVVVPFDQEFENNLFKIKLKKTHLFRSDLNEFKPDIKSFSFRFLSQEELAGMFAGRVGSSLRNNSTVLTVSMTGTVPARDVDYMNALLNEFQDYNLMLKNEQATLTIDFLTKQLALINDSLNISRVKLEKFQKETGVYEIKSPYLQLELDSADREKESLAVREKALLIATEKIKETIPTSTRLLDPNNIGINNHVLSRYIKEYNDLIEQNKNLGPKSPLYNRRTTLINDARRQILEELLNMQVDLQNKKDALVRKYKVLDARIDNLPPQERDLLKFERENRINEMYHQFLTQRKYEAQISKASNTPDNFILEEPRQVGGFINGGETRETYVYFLMISLILPLAFVVLKEEILNFSIMTKEECEKISGLPVIGTIENVSKKLANGMVLVKNYPKSSFAESFRNMRVRIEYMAQRENKITVLVTSTEPADGKTFIATNIASVYQLMGKKVIIVDLDLRRPSVGKTLKIESTKGISNYLIGQVTLDEIIISHPDYGFDIITAGTLPPNPSELIKTDKTREVLEHLKEVYDYVIVDCSPVGLVSDAYILSEIADTTLFVVRRAKTNRSFFKSVITQLRYDGVDNVALVFNDVKGREGYYGTSRYYGDKTYYLKKNSYYHDDYFEN